jgi:hypothetical protein
MRTGAQNNIKENSEHHSPVCPTSTFSHLAPVLKYY